MPNSVSSRKFRLLPLCALAICILVVANLVLSNLLSTKGIEFGQVTSQLVEIQSQNRRASLQLARLQSLDLLKQKAIGLGFVDIHSTIALKPLPGIFAQKM